MTKRRKRLSDAQMLAIAKSQDGRCAICGFPLDPREIAVDHIIHRHRGGSEALRNKRLTHQRCNARRGGRL
jgi:5-methylcytosine-specific restriction endonuclease McrA